MEQSEHLERGRMQPVLNHYSSYHFSSWFPMLHLTRNWDSYASEDFLRSKTHTHSFLATWFRRPSKQIKNYQKGWYWIVSWARTIFKVCFLKSCWVYVIVAHGLDSTWQKWKKEILMAPRGELRKCPSSKEGLNFAGLQSSNFKPDPEGMTFRLSTGIASGESCPQHG